jgi:hypothetical protein
VVALAAGLSLSSQLPASATGAVIDQKQTIVNVGPLLTKAMAQTFTAGMSGSLDHVSIVLGPTSATGTVEIRNVDSTGTPTGAALGTAADKVSFSSSTFNAPFYDFKFPTPIGITSGTQYAIVVVISVGVRSWPGAGQDAYAGGQGWFASCGTCKWFATTSPRDFAFETWVATSVNQAPTVAADSPAVSVAEGTAPANAGTYSDPDGDTVTLTASAGTVSKTGASSGTWAFSLPATDEKSMQTVTITADDGHGLTSSTPFTVTLTGVSPRATISIGAAGLAAGAASAPEGSAVSLRGSATSPSAADNAAGFSYGWKVTKNGAPFATGSGSTFGFTPDDEGTFVATLQATDDGGMTGSTSVTIAGSNVAPTVSNVTETPALTIFLLPQESVAFAGHFSDPGVHDSHTATWGFGDGATSLSSYGPSGSGSPTATHSYAAAGTYTATLTVVDDDGGVGQASVKVLVETPQQAMSGIAKYVQNLPSLNAGQKKGLIAKLNAASASSARGDLNACKGQLNSFLNELQADLNSGRVSAGDAKTLRDAVHAVEAALGIYNRYLEWWPLGA